MLFFSGFHTIAYTSYFMAYPAVFWKVVYYGMVSSIGQIFIFNAVNSYGALTCAIITTIRKFSTFFLSLIIFGHAISNQEILCVLSIIVGVGMDFYVKYVVKRKQKAN